MHAHENVHQTRELTYVTFEHTFTSLKVRNWKVHMQGAYYKGEGEASRREGARITDDCSTIGRSHPLSTSLWPTLRSTTVAEGMALTGNSTPLELYKWRLCRKLEEGNSC